MRDQIRIEVEAHRLLDGEDSPPAGLRQFAVMLSTLVCLLESAPASVDFDALDPLDPESFSMLEEVYAALRSAEDTFRGKSAGAGASGSQGRGGSDADVVPGEVQPAAE